VQNRADRRVQTLAKSRLRYESDIYLADMQRLEKKPLDHMQRKQHPRQFETMWGGSGLLSAKEDARDFVSTYHNSYVASTTDMSTLDRHASGLLRM